MAFLFLLLAIFALSPCDARSTPKHHTSMYRPWSDNGKVIVDPNVAVKYHGGPIVSSDMHVYVIWYGKWKNEHKQVIRDFISSVSYSGAGHPSVGNWWGTVRLYTDQAGKNVTANVIAGKEYDALYSRGSSLTTEGLQDVVKSALVENKGTLPVDPNGVYLVLTSEDVLMEEFCRAVCGFHMSGSISGHNLLYAWVGNSGTKCTDVCAFPFAVPPYMQNVTKALKPPNGNVGIDGMVTVIGQELAEVASDPFTNAWYAGDDPRFPIEIADMCVSVYGTGAGSGYPGNVLTDEKGASYNVHGINGRKFMVQWLWNPIVNGCYGPNV